MRHLHDAAAGEPGQGRRGRARRSRRPATPASAPRENRHEPFLSLAVAGAATKRIELHTGVAIAFARSPMTVANVGWTSLQASVARA